MKPAVSIIICTYNRPDILEPALKSVCNQTASKNDYEILVVDNNSTLDTKGVVDKYLHFGNVHYLFEKRQGHSYARNLGLEKAKGKYVGYIDDDCRVSKDWIARTLKVITEEAPGIFGGAYFADYQSLRPEWFKDKYASSKQWNERRVLREHEYLSGGNIFFRTELLKELGGFLVDFGMNGKKQGVGDETELLIRVRKLYPNETILYDPGVDLFHLVRPEKMTIGWNYYRFFSNGRCGFRVFRDIIPKRSFLKIAALFMLNSFGCLSDVLIQQFIRNKNEFKYRQNYLFEKTLPKIREMGSLYEQFKGRWSSKKRVVSDSIRSVASVVRQMTTKTDHFHTSQCMFCNTI